MDRTTTLNRLPTYQDRTHDLRSNLITFTCPQLVIGYSHPDTCHTVPTHIWSSMFLHHYSVCTNTNAAICTISFSPTKKLVIKALQNCSSGTDSRSSSHDSASLFTLMSPRRMTVSRVSLTSCPPASPRCSTLCSTSPLGAVLK